MHTRRIYSVAALLLHGRTGSSSKTISNACFASLVISRPSRFLLIPGDLSCSSLSAFARPASVSSDRKHHILWNLPSAPCATSITRLTRLFGAAQLPTARFITSTGPSLARQRPSKSAIVRFMSSTMTPDDSDKNESNESNLASLTLTKNENDDVEMNENVKANFLAVQERVATAEAARRRDPTVPYDEPVRLVAVSKTKPLRLLHEAYNAGCRCFGENYVQELIDKVGTWNTGETAPSTSASTSLSLLSAANISISNNYTGPLVVHWHFIGTLQSNKCLSLVNCMVQHGLYRFTVETVSTEKLAAKLSNSVLKLSPDGLRLKVFVQVNTSNETSKGGVEPGPDCIALCKYIVEKCAGLELRGLMTIGAADDTALSFAALAQCREQVTNAFQRPSITFSSSSSKRNSNLTNNSFLSAPLELSMGMSGDFEEAIAAGATNVRVGSTIFGNRDYSARATDAAGDGS